MRVQELGATAPRNISRAQLAGNEQPAAACICVGDEIEIFDENTLR